VRRTALALSATGYAAATGAAWLGGHLSYRKGVGVDQTAFDDGPAEWTAVLDEDEPPEGQLTPAQAGGVPLLLVRREESIHVLADRCSHRGCALHEGELHDDIVVCPCHGSTFRLDGAIVRGPATAQQPALEARVRDG
jgi:nitrite reductase/ring-hydroxylating ferredoxin subunit